MKTSAYLLLFSCTLFLSSCIVQAPKYTKVEQVLMLKNGMTREEVSQALGIPPYDIKSMNDSGSVTLIYKYRVTDRKTLPFLLKPANGVKTTGKWVDLFITYTKEGKVSNIESCSDCENTAVTERKVDFNAIILLVSVTLPAVLVYFGLQGK